jgi:hypothetical protein
VVLAAELPERALAWAQQNLSQPILEIGPIGGGLTRRTSCRLSCPRALT